MATYLSEMLMWERPPSALKRDLKGWSAALVHQVLLHAQKIAGQMEVWMRANAPWTNRTGDARAGLKARAQQAGIIITVIAYSFVPHQVFLETMQNGRFAILKPAVDHFFARFMAGLSRIAKGR